MAPARIMLTRPRRIATGSLAFTHLLLAFAYSQPALSRSTLPSLPTNSTSPGQISIVSYIDSLGPIWLIGFGVTSLLLITALLLRPLWLRWAHVAALAVSTSFCFALWAGFALSSPRPTIIAATLSIAVVGGHFAMSDLYSGALATVPRRRRQQP